MSSLGDFDTAKVVYFKFTTFKPSTGEPFTLGGTPALSVYKDNSTTQSTTGVTLTVDFDSVTGLNHVAIDTSADGTFYSAGSQFDIVITTGTVDSVSAVGLVVGRFSLRANSALKPTTSGRTLDVSAGGEAGIDWANVGSPTTTLNLSGTTIKTATDVETDTADIQSRLPAALVSGRIDASVGAMAANTLTASALATDAVTEIQSGLSTLNAADIRSAIGLASANLDTQLTTIDDFLDTEIAAIKAKTDTIPTFPTNFSSLAITVGGAVTAGTVSDKTGYSLATTPPTAAAIATQVRTELSVELGRIDAAVTTRLASASYTAPDNATISAIAGYVDTEVAAIKAKTDTIPTWPANFASLAVNASGHVIVQDGSITAAKLAADAITAAKVAADVSAEIAAAVESQLATDLGVINTGVKKASLLIPHTTDLT